MHIIHALLCFVVPDQQLILPEIILCMHPANERWRYSVTLSRHYSVTLSLIGWAHTQNNPYLSISFSIAEVALG